MTARVKGIGALTFMHTLWVDEFENPSQIMGETVISAAGTHIVYEAEIKTPYITLISKRNGWLNESDIAYIKAMYSLLDTEHILTYDDNTTETVRFAHEKKPKFTPVSESSKYYTAVIPLAKA